VRPEPAQRLQPHFSQQLSAGYARKLLPPFENTPK